MMRVRFFIVFLLAGMLWQPASVFGQDATATTHPGVTIHVVQRGETLFRIALAYNSSVEELARLNSLADPASIAVGQRLLVPSDDGTPLPPQSVMHIVQPGETADSIAAMYGLAADDLLAFNEVADADSIYVGQLLDVSAVTAPIDTPPLEVETGSTPTIPPTEVALAPEPSGTLLRHTVVSGDTLFRIAQQYGVSVNEIAQANRLNDPTLIYAGQELVIPDMVIPEIALDVPAFVTRIDVSPLIFVEGRSGRVQLQTTEPVSVTGTFLNQTLFDGAEEGDTSHTLLIAAPMFTETDIYPINLMLTDGAGNQTPLTVNVLMIAGGYSTENIQLIADRSNLLDEDVEEAELAFLRSLTEVKTATRYYDGTLGLPTAAPLSSSFGNRRSYNGGEATRFHTGTDFAAAPGTPILATAGGAVAFAGTLDVRGYATVIDHGWGVFTVYCHQTEQYVKAGDVVEAGSIIGTTGSTGRVTGAHLHWELWVNGVQVDPMQWVSESFS